MENGIFGIQPWAIFFVFIILVMGYIIYASAKNRKKKLEKYDNKLVVDLYTHTGVKTYLCEEEHGEIVLPKEYKDMDKSTISGKVNIPNSESRQDVTYFIQSQFLFDTWFPSGLKRKDQVRIKKTAFIEGICLPIVGIMLPKWTSEMLQSLSAELIGKADDANTLDVFNAQDSGFWNNIEWIRKQVQGIPMMKIACFVSAGAAIVTLLVVWTQIANKMDTLLKIWTGG